MVVIIFHFLRTLLIPLSFFSRLFSTFILDEKYTGCFIKIRNNSWGRPLWVIGIRIGIKLKINISYILAAALGDLGVIKKVCSLETSNLSPLPPPCSSLFILYVYTSSSYPLNICSLEWWVTPPPLKKLSSVLMNFWMKNQGVKRDKF